METGLKHGSHFGQIYGGEGGGGERGNATAAASGQITCLISQYVSSLGGVLSAAGRG